MKLRLTKSQTAKMKEIAGSLATGYSELTEREIINYVQNRTGFKVTVTGNKNQLWFELLNAYRSSGGKVIRDNSD